MSAKPAELPRWATSPLPDTVIAPPSDKRDIGWLPGERPPAEYINWLLQNLYYWVEWLDDGDCAFDALTAVTLAVSGLSTLQTLSVPGTATIATLNATAASATTLAVSGGTTLTGVLNANGGVSVPTGQTVALAGTATLSVNGTTSLGTTNVGGVLSGNGGITTQVLVTTGTDTVRHPVRERVIHAGGFRAFSTSSVYEAFTTTSPVATYDYSWRFGTVGKLVLDLGFLRAGDRIVGILGQVAWGKPTTSPAITTEIRSDSLSVTASTFTHWSSTAVAGNIPNTGIIAIGAASGVNVTISANVSYMLTYTCSGTANDNADMHLMAVRVLYDRP